MNFGSIVRVLSKMRQFYKWGVSLLCVLLLLLLYFRPSVRSSESAVRKYLPPVTKLKPRDNIDNSLNFRSRKDVRTRTAWGAPILWDGMFNPDIYDKHHQKMGTSVAVTVFAIGKYLEPFLKNWLSSAERHFMVGLPVTYYVFTDAPQNVPKVPLKDGRTLEVIRVERHKRWQDICMMRMKSIADLIQERIRHRHQYIFCMDVDLEFQGRFGSEALGDLVALQHSSFYNTPKARYTYDHNPNSTAYIKKGEGDLYYHAAVFGGSWLAVRNLTATCYEGIMTDKRNQVEALWHDESHLNKYLWLHKPSKVLSPEYGWNPLNGYTRELHIRRLIWILKDYSKFRS